MLADLKLGQYTKLPPRNTFAVQLAGTVVGAMLNCTYINTITSKSPVTARVPADG
jgi:hypothetical protein